MGVRLWSIPAEGNEGSAAHFVGLHAKVPEVDHGKVGGRDELREVAVRHHPDVLDDLFWWGCLAVAVVPSEVE
jgi:hypothetical protein